jgi:hypothetical protein
VSGCGRGRRYCGDRLRRPRPAYSRLGSAKRPASRHPAARRRRKRRRSGFTRRTGNRHRRRSVGGGPLLAQAIRRGQRARKAGPARNLGPNFGPPQPTRDDLSRPRIAQQRGSSARKISAPLTPKPAVAGSIPVAPLGGRPAKRAPIRRASSAPAPRPKLSTRAVHPNAQPGDRYRREWPGRGRQSSGCCRLVAVVGRVNSPRTQNGHIRNDACDVSRRTNRLQTRPICRRKRAASDRACTRVTLENLHGKEGGRSRGPSEQISEADVRGSVVLVVKVVGRGDTSLVFALTHGDASAKAVKAATHKIHSA